MVSKGSRRGAMSRKNMNNIEEEEDEEQC